MYSLTEKISVLIFAYVFIYIASLSHDAEMRARQNSSELDNSSKTPPYFVWTNELEQKTYIEKQLDALESGRICIIEEKFSDLFPLLSENNPIKLLWTRLIIQCNTCGENDCGLINSTLYADMARKFWIDTHC